MPVEASPWIIDAQALENYREIFQAADANGSGILGAQESGATYAAGVTPQR